MLAYELHLEDFIRNAEGALKPLRLAANDLNSPPQQRNTAMNAALLILAAIFEKFIREMAQSKAQEKISEASSIDAIPDEMIETAWCKTLQSFSKQKVSKGIKDRRLILTKTKQHLNDLVDAISGEVKKFRVNDFVKNDHNMRVSQINQLFKLSGEPHICEKIYRGSNLSSFFAVGSGNSAQREVDDKLTEFINLRNRITPKVLVAFTQVA